jgi:hypothetical protein
MIKDGCAFIIFSCHYSLLQSLSYLDEDFLMQLEGLYLDKAHEVSHMATWR